MTAGLNCAIVLDRIDLYAARYRFASQYIILFEKVAEGVMSLPIVPNTCIVLVEFKTEIKISHETSQIATSVTKSMPELNRLPSTQGPDFLVRL